LLDSGYLPGLHAAYHEALDEVWAGLNAREERLVELEDLESDLRNVRLQLDGANERIETLEAAIVGLNEALDKRLEDLVPPPAAESALESDEPELPPELRDGTIAAAASRWADEHAPAREAERLAYRPLVSVLLPTYNAPPGLLEAAVRSVLAQSYR